MENIRKKDFVNMFKEEFKHELRLKKNINNYLKFEYANLSKDIKKDLQKMPEFKALTNEEQCESIDFNMEHIYPDLCKALKKSNSELQELDNIFKN